MSPQHDWLKSFGPESKASSEADSAEQAAGTEADSAEQAAGTEAASAEQAAGTEAASAEQAGSEPASAGSDGRDQAEAAAEGGPQADAGQSAEAGQQAGATPGEPGRAGWSGRAVGPLSRLLPGGAVELDADELPAEPAAAAVADQQPLPAAGATGAEPATAAAADSDEPAAVDTADSTVAGEAPPAARRDEPVDDAEEPGPGLSATDDRWHAALVGFVDDPRGSVEAAKALIDEDIATHVALLARGNEAMHAAWQASKHADTETFRVALVKYRDLRTRLADVLSALTG